MLNTPLNSTTLASMSGMAFGTGGAASGGTTFTATNAANPTVTFDTGKRAATYNNAALVAGDGNLTFQGGHGFNANTGQN